MPHPTEPPPDPELRRLLAAWKRRLQHAAVALAWVESPVGEPRFGDLADHPGHPDPGGWEGLWRTALSGTAASALASAGWDVGILALVEVDRMTSVGVGPAGGAFRASEPEDSAVRRLRVHLGAETVGPRSRETYRKAVRHAGFPSGLRGGLRALVVRSAWGGDGEGVLGCTLVALAAAGPETVGRFVGDAVVDGRAGWRVHLEAEPTLDGDLLCVVTRSGPGDGDPGGVPDLEGLLQAADGRETRFSLPASEEAVAWYVRPAPTSALTLLAWSARADR